MRAKVTMVWRVAFTIGVVLAAVCTVAELGAECVPVLKTGQTGCYDDTGKGINCRATGQDGEYQTGMAWPQPRFTDAGDGTVLDNLTTLVWTKDAQHIKGTMSWVDALAACNSLVFAGHGDWRLPNVRELLSLIDYEQHDPALPQGHPFEDVQYLFYWSGTTYDASPVNAWGVYLCNGYTFNYHKTTRAYVWPARSAEQGDKQAPSILTGHQAE